MFVLYLYCDRARMLVDWEVVEEPVAGAIGSNWQYAGQFDTAEEAESRGRRYVRESLEEEGWTAGHNTQCLL